MTETRPWHKVRLADVSLGKGEYGSGASAVPFDPTKPRYVRITDIDDEGRLKSNDPRSPSIVEPEHFLEEGDFLFARSGSIGRTYVHEAGSGRFQYAGYLITFKLDKSLMLPKYLYYLTKSRMYWHWIEKETKSVTIANINARQYANFSFPLPPLSQQVQSVRTFEAIQRARTFRAQADGLTDSFLKSVFFEMFGDPLLNPMRWPTKRVADFGRVMTGNTPPRRISAYYGDHIDWVKSDNLNTPFTFTTRSEEKLSEKGAQVGRIAPKGSVLVTCIAGSLSSIGNAAIADRDVAFNQQINAVIPGRDVDSFFLYHLMVLSKKLIQDSSTHSMKGMVSKSTFEDIRLISPPLELQQRFGTIARKQETVVENQTVSKRHIDSLFDAKLVESFRRWS